MYRLAICVSLTLAALTLLSCTASSNPEATSLLGRPLFAIPIEAGQTADFERKLAEAHERWLASPEQAESWIWYGRRLAYLGRYQDALQLYTDALARFPDDYRLLRHRGHRYITTRRFDLARLDLENAAALARDHPDAVEPDGLPNRLNLPRSTDKTNIAYHLGLACYLQGDWRSAAEGFGACLTQSTNDDMDVAARYWLYLALRRAGEESEAIKILGPVHPDMDVVENVGYLRLLLLYKGVLPIESVAPGSAAGAADAVGDATVGYGLAMWSLLNGRQYQADRAIDAVLQSASWPAFGFIAAEAESARRAGRFVP